MAQFLSSSQSLRLQCLTAGASVVAVASVCDISSSGAVTAQPAQVVPAITTASTVTLVGSPAANTVRNVRGLTVTNGASTTATVEIEVYDGSNSVELIRSDIKQLEKLVMDESGTWVLYDSAGRARAASQISQIDWDLPGGHVAQTMSRAAGVTTNLTSFAGTGGLFLMGVWLTAGQVVNGCKVLTGTTAGVGVTKFVMGVYDPDRVLLGKTADLSSGGMAATTLLSGALSSPVTIQKTGMHYVGITVTATTMPSLFGAASGATSALMSLAPALCGLATGQTSGLTDLPNNAGAPTGAAANGTVTRPYFLLY